MEFAASCQWGGRRLPNSLSPNLLSLRNNTQCGTWGTVRAKAQLQGITISDQDIAIKYAHAGANQIFGFFGVANRIFKTVIADLSAYPIELAACATRMAPPTDA